MGEAYIVRKGGAVSDTTAAPTITIISEDPDGVTFTLTNNDDNTAIISYDIDTSQGAVELAAAATSGNITVALSAGTYTLTAYATVVGEVATSATSSVEIVVPQFELLYDSNVSATLPLTQIDITGLSISKDDELRLVFNFIGDTTITSLYQLFPNSQTTVSNYHLQELGAFASTAFAARANTNRIANARSNERVQGFVDIKVSNNDIFVAQSQYIQFIGSESASIQNRNENLVGSGFTLTSITSLSIVATRTNGIATGSRIRLYKVNTGEA
jgi:hypothetical protein